MRFLLITILAFSVIGPLMAQKLPYKISFIDGHFDGRTQLAGALDSAGFRLEVTTLRNQLFSRGYMLANVDAQDQGDSLLATIYVGPKYTWYALGVRNIPEEYLSKAGYRSKDFINKEISAGQFSRLVNRLLNQATGAGYPFAIFQLSDIEIQDSNLKALLNYQPGPEIKYDTLTLNPPGLVRAAFLQAHLRLIPGSPFNYEQVNNLDAAIEQLPYVRLSEPSQVKFANNLCNIYLDLEKVKANRFDAVIGFLPNQSKTQGLRLTGYADLHLDNLFKAGKSITFNWQQFQSLSQTILLDYNHPNLFRSPLGLGLQANLVRQDTSFLNTSILFNVFYTKNNLELGLRSNIISSRSLSTPDDLTSQPFVADYNMRLFGVNLNYQDMLPSAKPSSGFRLATSIQFGAKSLNVNPGLPASVYDTLDDRTNQLQANIELEVNKGINRLLMIHANLQAATIWNSDQLFINDLLRLGGLRSLRGFNELELFVSSFGLARFEFRVQMGGSSNLFLFYDQAITLNTVSDHKDLPLGFGAGFNLGTPAGNLQLVYALGVSQEQSLSLDQSKIHLGYVATF